MSSKQFDTIWKAEPHTIAKITILEAYLQAWFQIMGRSMVGTDILYVDGFAGPGEYTNFPKGSSVAALNAAKTALESSGHSWKAGNMHCAFIESDSKRFEHLQQVVGQIEASKGIKVHLVHGNFGDVRSQSALRRDG